MSQGKLSLKTPTTQMRREKIDQLTPSKQAQPTTESGSVVSETDGVSNNGQMVLDMKDSGRTIELMERVNSLILMETSMMVNG